MKLLSLKIDDSKTACPVYSLILFVSRIEAEFLDVIGTKVLRVFLLAIHSRLY